MKIFGREPVYILAFVAIVLKLGAGYGLNVSDEQQTLINTALACAVAIISAIVLHDGAVGAAIVNFAQAALALFLGYGLDMTAQEQAGWMAAVAGAVALWEHREVTAPVPSTPLERTSPYKGSTPAGV
ncbi:hypothetical protein [Streptomyces sp. OR43]|uniref:hypothetical protein n=1 Tax=Streptomyces sp. or43 TaxID=2478957 RepID=UPI0011CE0E2F|nr:hypothetical protein [Streptomyces sp. or43]TXS44926.1 hypothetical protein EAO72_07850 [Streptomyces sp. or43]